MRMLWCALLFLAVTGCSFIQPIQQPTINNYELNAVAAKPKAVNRPSRLILLVNNTLPSPGYDSNKIAYSQQAYRLDYYTVNRWIAPPAQMFTLSLINSLQQSHYFKAIATVPYVGPHDLRLDTRMLSIKQDLTTTPNEVVVSVYAQLVNAHNLTIIANQEFEARVSCDASPQAAVLAANKALSEVLGQILDFSINNIPEAR
jgi:ABC-type uncharacterized transport system auxiliary subunit